MRWLQSESILKGVFLGLVAYIALQEPSWPQVGQVAAFTVGGLVAALLTAAALKWREGYRVAGRLPAFVLFLLLENPGLIYIGVIGGTVLGAMSIRPTEVQQDPLAYCIAGGALLGFIFWQLRHVEQRWYRLGLSLLLGATLVYAALYWFGQLGDISYGHEVKDLTALARVVLLSIPVFYLLTFAGQEEESEIEIGAMCAALGLGLSQLTQDQIQLRSLSFLVPVMLFFWYTMRVLPGLRVFKYTLRGFSYAKVGRYRPALLAFRRALQLDPNNHLAREGLWSVHRAMDLTVAARDPELVDLIDLDLCLDRAATLLVNPGPKQPMLEEAHRLLDVVVGQRPALEPRAWYWRAVAHLHGKDHDRAGEALARVVATDGPLAGNPGRGEALLQAWQLALFLHPEMHRRVGSVQLGLPGRRMEAIGAVERQLAVNPEDKNVWDLKRLLYSGLTGTDYDQARPAGKPAADFDHEYAQQLGLALIEDSARWQRGAEYLQMAVCGLPAQGPSLFTQIAQACQKAGLNDEALRHYELAKRAGLAVGPKSLPEAERHTYFAAVKLLAEHHAAQNDLDRAIEHYHLYTEYERSGLPTLMVLTELYERRGDPLMALRINEQALQFDGKNKDLLARKDKYYYSVMPADVQARLETIGKSLDVAYCLTKAASLLKAKVDAVTEEERVERERELTEWALHLAEVARMVQPSSLEAKVLSARARLRLGERDEGVALLEDVHTNKPEKFATYGDEDAWYFSCQQLAELYLYELEQPEKAVKCLLDFRKSPKSGANSLYKLGEAYEKLGDRNKAIKYYEHVDAYDGHPLQSAARDAIYRLRSSGAYTE